MSKQKQTINQQKQIKNEKNILVLSLHNSPYDECTNRYRRIDDE